MAPCAGVGAVVSGLDGRNDVHHIELLRLHHLAGDTVHDGVRARTGADGAVGRVGRVVGADVGAHRVRVRRGRRGICQTSTAAGGWSAAARRHAAGSLFEVTLGKAGGEDFYDVSLVDGYNLPVVAIPRALRGQGTCNATGCMADLNSCPKELQVDCGAGAITCRSACEAFRQDSYCCSGDTSPTYR
ncbi:hypothetical protein QYE76_034276 [Lolium multiflorum]|uniref:Thaumatin-like protein n=1 Tax=Lolium multiflorum TaxID=4521 RepID=A0AAD8R0R1_LOLMU|nr:hypothetical protein QYE76_034276 [Lolium multiflorum]